MCFLPSKAVCTLYLHFTAKGSDVSKNVQPVCPPYGHKFYAADSQGQGQIT